MELGSVKDDTMFRGRSRSFLYQKRSEQSEQKMNKSPCSSRGHGKARPSRDTSHDLHHEGKVSCLRLMAIIWTASSDAARQACGKAAARWGNAQAVTPS